MYARELIFCIFDLFIALYVCIVCKKKSMLFQMCSLLDTKIFTAFILYKLRFFFWLNLICIFTSHINGGFQFRRNRNNGWFGTGSPKNLVIVVEQLYVIALKNVWLSGSRSPGTIYWYYRIRDSLRPLVLHTYIIYGQRMFTSLS